MNSEINNNKDNPKKKALISEFLNVQIKKEEPNIPEKSRTSYNLIDVQNNNIQKNNSLKIIDEIIKPNSKYPNGALGCYATSYGKPCGTDDYIPCGPIGKCDPTKERADYDSILKVGDYWMCDKVFTVKGVELPTKYTPNGVAILEADGVQFRSDCGPITEIAD